MTRINLINELIRDYLIKQGWNKKPMLEPKINGLIREYLIKQRSWNNKILLDIFVEGFINNDISEFRILLDDKTIRDIKQIIRDHKLSMILDKEKYN